MNRVDTKKLYLGVYTKDGKHIPIRIWDIVWRLRSLVLAKSILAVPYYNASMH